MKATMLATIPLLCASLLAAQSAPAPAPQAAAGHRLDRVTAARAGERVFVHVTADAVAASVGAPEPLEGGARLTLILRNTALGTALPLAQLHESGLSAVRLEQRGGDVAVLVEAESVGEYGLEPRAGGVMLWFEPARSESTDTLGARAAIARSLDMASGWPETVRTAGGPEAGTEPMVNGRWPASAPAPRGTVAGAVRQSPAEAGLSQLFPAFLDAAGRSVATALRERDALIWALPGLATALLGLLLVWRFSSRRRTSAASAAAARDVVPGGAAFAWAARTLSAEGLDTGGIARRTGIARDAVHLLLHRMDPANPAGPGSPFRSMPGRSGTWPADARPVSH